MSQSSCSLIIREAAVADVPAIENCRDATSGLADPRIAAYLSGEHHPQQALPPRVAYMAIVGDSVAGYIAGHLTRRLDCHGELQYLYVNPHHRRVGIATALLHILARWFVEQNALRICVNVDPESPSASAFYAHRGAVPLNKHWSIWQDISHLCRTDRPGAE